MVITHGEIDGKLTTIETLILSLGYCCPHVFFSLYPSNSLIAYRLGVSTRQVRRWRSKFNSNSLPCRGLPNCQKKILSFLPKSGDR